MYVADIERIIGKRKKGCTGAGKREPNVSQGIVRMSYERNKLEKRCIAFKEEISDRVVRKGRQRNERKGYYFEVGPQSREWT